MNRLRQVNVPIQVQASLVVLSAQLCFSGWHIVGSVAFRGGTDPVVFILYRLFIGTLLMHLYIRYYKMGTFIDPVDHRRMYLAGVLSFLNVICGSCSLKYIAPSRFAIFQPCIPCVVTAISMGFKLEQMSNLKLVGIALAVAGAFVAELWKTGSSDSKVEANVPLGVVLAIMQVTAMGSLVVVVKPLVVKYEPAVVSAMYFIVSCAAIVVVVLCRIDIIPLNAYAFNGQGMAWLALMYVAIFATMYSFSAINWGGKFLPPTVTTVFFTFQPVGTIILSATLLGVNVTVPQALGGVLIVCGLFVTSYAQSRGPKSATALVNDAVVEQAHRDHPDAVTNVIHGNGVTELEFKPRSRSTGSAGGGTYNPLLLLREDGQQVNDEDSMHCSAKQYRLSGGNEGLTAGTGMAVSEEEDRSAPGHLGFEDPSV
jgi:drug/metabolite transporter (DMT)-like permease